MASKKEPFFEGPWSFMELRRASRAYRWDLTSLSPQPACAERQSRPPKPPVPSTAPSGPHAKVGWVDGRRLALGP